MLLVEDNPGALETFTSFFSAAGFDVRVAATGAAGLVVARADGVHAIVADLCLPDLTGLELLEEVRALGLDMPFIMMSGHATTELKAKARQVGAVEFLVKPVDGDELIRTVRLAIQRDVSALDWALAVEPVRTVDRTQPRSEAIAAITAFVAAIASAVNLAASTEVRRRLAEALVVTIVRPNLTACELLACAEGLRRVVTAREGTSPAQVVEDTMDAVARLRTPETRRPYHAKVAEALAWLASPDGAGLRLSEVDLAREIGLSRSRLGRVLRAQTGLAFREWRRGLRMRLAVRRLAVTDDVYQIAYSLGYKHVSQFDDEFGKMFGLSPRAFRTTLRAAAAPC